MTTAIIFAGPSLPPKLRPAAGPSLQWRPPVRQGELYRAALTRPSIIGVIDGYFEVTPTVWHKEILWAMAEGIHVYGAASAGALRAAELDSFGMRGIGRVYEDFRDGVLQDDDEVAVLHGPEEVGYPPVTEAMVNIRVTLAAAVQQDVIAPEIAAGLREIAKRLFYKERSYEALLEAAANAGWPAASLRDLVQWLPGGRVDQKQSDAHAMIATIRAHLRAGVNPLRISYRLADTAAWQAARRSVGEATT